MPTYKYRIPRLVRDPKTNEKVVYRRGKNGRPVITNHTIHASTPEQAKKRLRKTNETFIFVGETVE